MTYVTGTVLYLIIWWTTLFTVLPLGVRRHEDDVPGLDRGAPERPDLKRKLFLNTLIAAGVWLVVYFAVNAGIIPFREIAREMSETI